MVTVETESEYTTPNNLKDYQVIKTLLLNLEKIWHNIKLLLFNVGAYDLFDKTVLLSIKHPHFAILAGICIIAFVLPFLMFLVFVLSTIVMTLTGLVLIEGTLITIASVILFGCLGAIFIVLLFFGVITIVCYFGFMHVYDLHNNLNQKTALTNFLINERNQKY